MFVGIIQNCQWKTRRFYVRQWHSHWLCWAEADRLSAGWALVQPSDRHTAHSPSSLNITQPQVCTSYQLTGRWLTLPWARSQHLPPPSGSIILRPFDPKLLGLPAGLSPLAAHASEEPTLLPSVTIHKQTTQHVAEPLPPSPSVTELRLCFEEQCALVWKQRTKAWFLSFPCH